jgi:hypothetical protein
MTRKTPENLSLRQKYQMSLFLTGLQEDGKINERIGGLMKKISAFLGVDVGWSSVDSMIDAMDIEIIRNTPMENNKPAVKDISLALENRVAVLEQKVNYLMNEWKGAGCKGDLL